jgi:transcriptional regulator with XRE-family HTH domain
MSIDQHVARRIKGKRMALGLSEDDLAKAIGVERGVRARRNTGASGSIAEAKRVHGRPYQLFLPERSFSGLLNWCQGIIVMRPGRCRAGLLRLRWQRRTIGSGITPV